MQPARRRGRLDDVPSADPADPAPPVAPPRRVLVTGASGNVGTALLRRLAAEGVEVSAVARRVPRPRDSPATGARWHGIDLAQRWAVPALREAMADVDAVVHLAWAIQPSHDERRTEATNVGGTRHVVEAALDAGVPHLVHASSVGAYAAAPGRLVDEDHPHTGMPTSGYSRHKAAAEAVLDDLEASPRGRRLVVSRVRPGLVMQREAGPEIARYFAGPLLPARLLGRLPLPVLPVPAALTFQVVHADDLADAFWRVLATRLPGAVNVAADPPLTADDLARALGAGRALDVPVAAVRVLADATWRLHLQPTGPGWVDLAAGVPFMSTERARTALGWAPAVAPVAALADLVAGMRSGAGAPTAPLRRRGPLAGRHEPTS